MLEKYFYTEPGIGLIMCGSMCLEFNFIVYKNHVSAGIMFVPYAETEDGFESHFAVNYLGHCLLTHLLLPCMINTAKGKDSNCRIVNVSSCAHLAGAIKFRDLSMR
jgi:hypothetical protein